jgi:hypothetical protein
MENIESMLNKNDLNLDGFDLSSLLDMAKTFGLDLSQFGIDFSKPPQEIIQQVMTKFGKDGIKNLLGNFGFNKGEKKNRKGSESSHQVSDDF